jgi:outer membrane protein W
MLALAGSVYGASLKQGTQEIVVEGLFDADGAAGDELDLSLKYGQFIQDNIEVGAFAGFSDNDVVNTYEIGGFGEYNIDLGNELVPYVGAGIGWISLEADDSDADEDGYGIYGEVGVKYFLAENVAVSAAGIYEWASEDVYVEDGEATDDNITLNLAMRFYIP